MSSARPILVLDDDSDLLVLVQRTLEHDGWRVVAASDAETALRAYEDERPCLLFVDLMLPHMDGEAFVRTLRERDPELPPLVLLTASEARDEVAERVDATEVLAKPFELEDVRALAREHCAAEPTG